jgi:two-component system chemotaxis response regulator CheB
MSLTQRPLRVIVAENSISMRAQMVNALSADRGIRVVAEAADGRTAIDQCLQLRPDVVTMDMMLPVITGMAATEHLMVHCPTPILFISTAGDRGEVVGSGDALAAGAVDVLAKPPAHDSACSAQWNRKLVATVKLAARIQVITHVGQQRRGEDASGARGRMHQEALKSDAYSLVVIGASAGGPRALVALLSTLPRSFSLPILLVLHVNERFNPDFAAWLSVATGRPARLAVHGERVSSAAREVLIAPAGHHLTVRRGVVALTRDAERHSCRPSVDVLFESVASEYGTRAAACLLTGMGRDGACGLLAIHRSGGLTIVQDEETCAVYGMPREAVRLGAAQHVLPIDRIGPALDQLTGVGLGAT